VRWFGVGKPVTTSAVELGVSAAAIHSWVGHDQVEGGRPWDHDAPGSRRPGFTTPGSIELGKAKKRIRQLEEVAVLKKVSKLFGQDRPRPKGVHLMIDAVVGTGHRAKLCCRRLGVSSLGYDRYKKRPMSPTQMRRLVESFMPTTECSSPSGLSRTRSAPRARCPRSARMATVTTTR